MNKEKLQIVIRKNLSLKEYEEIRTFYNDGKHLDRAIDFTNIYYNEKFFVIGIDRNIVISAIIITKNPDDNAHYLISDLNVKENNDTNEIKEYLISSTISILKDFNCTKIGAFIDKTCKEIFEKIGFVKVCDDYIFGNEKMSISCADPYYEIKINQDYHLEEINEANSKIVTSIIMKKKNEHSKNIPEYFKDFYSMFRKNLITLNDYDNEQAFIIMNGKTIFGYTYMFSDTKEHSLCLRIDLGEDHLYYDAVKIVVDKAKEYFKENKVKMDLEKIVFYVNDDLLLKEEFEFYRQTLKRLNFKTINGIRFEL